MKKPPSPPPSLRAQKKQAVRQALIVAAHRRFHRFGFEATTIDEICADADVSRRSFFRYFPDKGALVFPQRAERLQRFFDLLLEPDSPDPLTNLRRIARLFAKEYSDHRESLLAQQRLIDASADLQAREREIDRDWEDAITRAICQRLHQPDAEMQARLFAGAAIGIIRATMRYWFEQDGKPDLAALGQKALDSLELGFFRECGAAGEPRASRSLNNPPTHARAVNTDA